MVCVCPDVSAMANLYSACNSRWATSSVIGLHNYLSVVQVILPEIAEYDVMVQIKACGLSRIDTKVNNLSLPQTISLSVFSIRYLCLQTLSELNPTSDQIPVGFEITGIVTKGSVYNN